MNTAKQTIILLFLLIPAFLFSSPQTPGGGTTPPDTEVPLKGTGGGEKGKRPKDNFYQYVVCRLTDGLLTISFTLSEGMCRGSVTDLSTGRIKIITFDSSPLTVELDADIITSGQFSIQFTTDLGNTYSGSTDDFPN